MSTNVRKYVSLNRRLATRVKLQAKAQGLSEAEVIRRAVAVGLPEQAGEEDRHAAWETLEGLLRERQAKGPLPGKRTWTREDAYEERLSRYGPRVSG